ncbi:Dipeptide transport system permease protein DppB [Anaerolineae bacterium]|nr:Dipeptide transport system permease protein DppB [Anaerolineae bacterium]
MTQYIIRRLIQAVPVLFVVSVLVFTMIQVAPNNPLSVYQNNPNISPEDLRRLEEEYGFNDPIHIKYGKWLSQTLRGNWGDSFVTHRPVLTEIGERFPNTLYLSLIAFVLALVIAIPIGIISAIRQYSLFDHVVTTVAFMGQSIPIFWFGLILIIVFSVNLQNPFAGTSLFPHPAPLPMFPGGGMTTLGEKPPDPLVDRIWHLVLPVSMLAVFQLAQHVRYMRAGMLEVLKMDYIRTAYAKGMKERAVVYKHAFKNAALPLVTIIALEIPALFNGALFTETIFSWPGMGRLFFSSAERGDYTVLMGILMISAMLIIFFNLVADITYAFLDPRIRFD